MKLAVGKISSEDDLVELMKESLDKVLLKQLLIGKKNTRIHV